MALETPNFFVASGYFDPDMLPDNPIINSEGFQPWDPTSETDGVDLSNIRGGFTRAGVGLYFLKTIEGADPLEANPQFMPFILETNVGGVYIPNGIPGIPPTINDGNTIACGCVSAQDAQPVDAPFYVNVFRWFVGLQTLADGPAPP